MVVNTTQRCHSHSHSLDTKEWTGSADECEVRGLAQARSEQQEEFIARTTGRETKWKREEQQKTGDPSTAAKILLLAQISL